MALISCPDCAHQISTKATNCPHCGYPLQPRQQKSDQSRTSLIKREKERQTNMKISLAIGLALVVILIALAAAKSASQNQYRTCSTNYVTPGAEGTPLEGTVFKITLQRDNGTPCP